MIEDLRRRLAPLESEVDVLRSEIEKVSEEARLIAEERNRINIRVRELRVEAVNFRDKRNALNEEVKGLKAMLSELKRECSEKVNALRELRQRIKEHLRAKPSRDEEGLKKEIAELDWRIQTTPLSLDEEKRIIERIRTLESQLSFYLKLNSMRDEISAIEKRLETLREEISSCKNRIAETISKSQDFHDKMVERLKEVDRLRAEADELHKKYLAKREKVDELCLKYRELLNHISAIRKAIREEEERKKAEFISALKEKIGKEALEKLKRGEKISFEEFKILAEQGKI